MTQTTLSQVDAGGIAGAIGGNEPPEDAESPAISHDIASELDEMPTGGFAGSAGGGAGVDNDLSGDPRVMQSNPRNASQIVAAVTSGDPAGLEHMWFGSTLDGTPSITYIDDFGQVQVHRVTTAQWLAGQEARGLNRMKATEKQNEMQELNEKKTELRPTFEDGLDSVDDPAYRALLQQMFDDDPQLAIRELIEDRRGSSMDEEKNQAKREAMKKQQAWGASQRQQGRRLQELDTEKKRIDATREQLMQGNEDPSAGLAQIANAKRMWRAEEDAMTHSPVPATAGMSPSEGMSSQQFQNALASWLPLIDGMIPHTSTPQYETIMRNEVLPALNEIAMKTGWQEGLTEFDLEQVDTAIFKYRNVHGEAIQIHTLTKENEALQVMIDELKAQQKDATPIQQAQKTRQEYMEKKDINKDGVIDTWEQQYEVDPAKVELLKTDRAEYQGTAAAKARIKTEEADTEQFEKQRELLEEYTELSSQLYDLDIAPSARTQVEERHEELYKKLNEENMQEDLVANLKRLAEIEGMEYSELIEALKDKDHEKHAFANKLRARADRTVKYFWKDKYNKAKEEE